MYGLNIVLQALACFLVVKEVVSATTHNQSGCYNTDVMLSCPYYTQNKPGKLVWRFYDKTVSKWAQIASIRNGNLKVTSANTALDGRSAIHPNGSLEVTSLHPDDETVYQCLVRQGSRKLHVINLDVSCGKVTVMKREVCVEGDVVLECEAKYRANPRKLDQVKWHKKNTSGNDVSWSLLVASNGSHATAGDGFKLHGNGSLLLQGGREESEIIYKCDVTKNVPSRLDRHIIVVKNVKCQNAKHSKGTIKTMKGRIAMTTASAIKGTNVAMVTSIPATISQGCGGVLNNPAGTFQSPNFPSPYPANSHCKWTISVPQGYAAIDITLDRVNLEHKVDCRNDSIAIYDELSNQVGCRICGAHTSPLQIQVKGKVAVVVFRANSTVQHTGFKASYRAH